MSLELQPVTFREACNFIAIYHRHHKPPQGFKFAIGCNDSNRIVGVVVVGRPVSRHSDDGYTAEVTRLCTDGTKNAASMLYAAAWRAARAMGYRRLETFILVTEPGTSLLAAGWHLIGSTDGKTWSRSSRLRFDKHPLGQRLLWERA